MILVGARAAANRAQVGRWAPGSSGLVMGTGAPEVGPRAAPEAGGGACR